MAQAILWRATLGILGLSVSAAVAGEPLSVPVMITLLEEARVPAREPGVLVAVGVREGAQVKEGDLLAQIDDTEAQFLEERAGMEREIAAKNAANEIGLLTAEKTLEVARAQYERADATGKKFRNSISQTELDRLRLDGEKAALAVRQAKHDLQIAELTCRLKQNERDYASRSVDRRRILAPLPGMVVEVERQRGEWVQPGDTVVRIVRLDRLRAEGFIAAPAARADLAGCPVRLEVDLPEKASAVFVGQLVFVSPEVDPVNNQVRVLAEIDNPEFLLRPGLRATLTVDESAPRSFPDGSHVAP